MNRQSEAYLNEASRVLEGVSQLWGVFSQGARLVVQLVHAGGGQQHDLRGTIRWQVGTGPLELTELQKHTSRHTDPP